MKLQEFLQIEGPTVVEPMRTDKGQMLGWAVLRNGIDLERHRGGVRIFKTITAIEVFCTEHGIEEFKVVVRS